MSLNSFPFSFSPFGAIVLWAIPLIVSVLLTIRCRVLRGISGAIAQLIGTYIFLVIIVEFLLGVFGILTYGYVLLAFVILLLITVLTTDRQILTSIWAIDKWLPQGIKRIQVLSGDFHRYLWFVLMICLIYLAIAVQKIFSPPIHIDCLWAYLPQVIGWLQTHNIFEHNAPLSFYHHSSLLMALWTILPFGTDLFINLQNLPATLLAFTAIVHLLRIFRVNRKISFLAGLAFLNLPNVAYWMWNQKTEILLTGFFILCLCFIVEYFQRGKSLSLFYGLCCAGLVVGTKTFGLYYGFLLYVVVIVFCLINKKYRKWSWLVAGSIVCLIFALQWPIRNWIIWNNPFYPMEISILGHSVFAGPGFIGGRQLDSMFGTSIVANLQLRYVPLLFQGALLWFGLVGLLALIVLPVSLLAAFKMRMRLSFLFLSMIAIGSYICYVFIPNTTGGIPGAVDFLKQANNVYYAMPFFAVAVIVLVIVVGNLKSQFNLVLEFVLLTQITYGILQYILEHMSSVSKPLIILAQGLAILTFFIVLFCFMIAKIHPRMFWLFLGVGLLFLALVGGFVFESSHKYKVRRGMQSGQFIYFSNISPDLLEWIEENISKKTVIVCSLEPGYEILQYPLFGSKLNNKVIRGPRFTKSYQPNSNIDIVVVSGKKREGNEDDLIQLLPWTKIWGENIGFQQVFSNGVQCVYERKE